MAHEGMDVDRVVSIAHQLKTHADSIDRVVTTVSGLVAGLPQVWQGNDARDFEGWWTQQHRPALVHVSAAVHGLGQSALNNSKQQDAASQASGGGSPHGVQPGTPAPQHSGAPVHGSQTVGSRNAAAFAAANPPGGKLGNGQCVYVFEEYNQKTVGAPFVGVGESGGAKDFYEKFDSLPVLGQYYDKIPPGTSPQPGDVVVWGSGVGADGHIAVCTSSSGSQFTVVEQNAPSEGAPIRDYTYSSTDNVIGYLRPKADE